MKIVIDADACPRRVLEICRNLSKKYHVPLWTVASFNHVLNGENHITVGNAPQEADIKVVNISQAGDIAITQDWGLAAMLLGKNVHCLSPTGQRYSNQRIDFLLEERNLKARHRRGGGRTRGPKKRTLVQDQRFAASLEQLLQAGENT